MLELIQFPGVSAIPSMDFKNIIIKILVTNETDSDIPIYIQI